mgnify:CR=1 FL=1
MPLIRRVPSALCLRRRADPDGGAGGVPAITRDDILKSGDLLTARPQLSPRDALHAATALNNGITVIVSVDTELDHIEGLARLDPAAV